MIFSARGAVWVKICGLTSPAQAEGLLVDVATSPDALGLNFVEGGSRFIDLECAADIARVVAGRCPLIGVFVNEPAEEVARIVQSVRLTGVQLHGDESVNELSTLRRLLPEIPLIKAWRMSDPSLADWRDYLQECRERRIAIDAVLIDAAVAGQWGGTGHTAPWDELCKADRTDWPRLILAGGLRPENVRQAIQSTRPFGVDTASGVEAAPGVKQRDKVAKFLAAARSAS